MSNTPARDEHVYGLDWLRFVAAILVAAFHFTRTLAGLELAFPFGWIGVELFFVISGVVIAYSAQHAGPMRFLESRFLRLYPAAWIVAGISFSIIAIVPRYFWHSVNVYVYADPLSVLNTVALTGIGVSGSYWTLPVELSFYACIFLLLLVRRLAWLRHVALGLTIFSACYNTLLGLYYLLAIDTPWIDFGLGLWNASLLRHGAFFALGLYLFQARGSRLAVREQCGAGLAVVTCGVEIACRAAGQMQEHSISEAVLLPLLIIQVETIFLLGLLAMVAALQWNAAFPRRLRGLSRVVGLATYPFYLLHEVLGGLTIYLLLRIGAGSVAAVAAAMLVVGAVAFVVSAWIEPRLRRAIAALLASVRRRRGATLGAT